MSKWAAELTGPVTPSEAREILSRFNASHFREPGKEHARYSIPTDPKRDDDIRMSAFIEHVELLLEAAAGAVAHPENQNHLSNIEAAAKNLKDA